MRAWWLMVLAGCALFSKGEVTVPRYFTAAVAASPVVRTAGSGGGARVRLGRVTASRALGERMMYRTSDTEVGYRDDRLWTEAPDAYLRRALERELFEVRGATSLSRAGSPTVDVELVEFVEVLAPRHEGRVRVAVTFTDGEGAGVHRTLVSHRPVDASSPGDEAHAVARAIAAALEDVVAATADVVIAELRTGGASADHGAR